jgi:hypothetical protein
MFPCASCDRSSVEYIRVIFSKVRRRTASVVDYDGWGGKDSWRRRKTKNSQFPRHESKQCHRLFLGIKIQSNGSDGQIPKKYHPTHDAVASLLRHVLEHRLLVRFGVDDALKEWHRTGAVEAPDDAVTRGRTLRLIL